MPAATGTPSEAPDPETVMRYHYRLLARRLGLRVGIFGFLFCLPLLLRALGAPNSFWAAFPVVPGAIGLVFTFVFCKGHPLRLRKCRKVLDHYPLTPGTVTLVGRRKSRYDLTFSAVELARGDGAERATMLAIEPQGLLRWPKGTEEDVYVAGDLAFGAVVVVPGNNELYLMRPEPYDDAAPARNAAAPDRIERAKTAGIELIPF
jgi:hypothetical protein